MMNNELHTSQEYTMNNELHTSQEYTMNNELHTSQEYTMQMLYTPYIDIDLISQVKEHYYKNSFDSKEIRDLKIKCLEEELLKMILDNLNNRKCGIAYDTVYSKQLTILVIMKLFKSILPSVIPTDEYIKIYTEILDYLSNGIKSINKLMQITKTSISYSTSKISVLNDCRIYRDKKYRRIVFTNTINNTLIDGVFKSTEEITKEKINIIIDLIINNILRDSLTSL